MKKSKENRTILFYLIDSDLIKILSEQLKFISEINIRIYSFSSEDTLEYNEYTDLIVQEYNPELSSDDNFIILNSCKESQYNPSFLFIGPAIGEMSAVQCIKQGADDYLLLNHLNKFTSVVKEILARRSGSDKVPLEGGNWGSTLGKIFDRSYASLKDKFEKQLHFNEKLMGMLPADIYLTDLSVKSIRFYNMNILNRLGFTQKDFENRDKEILPNFVHPDDLERVYEINREISTNREDKFFNFEYRVKDKAGNWYWLHSREIVFKRNEEGFVTHVLGVTYDISQLKKVEKELAEKNENLEEMVAVRTFELQQSNEDLERFAYIASHDLQEPLRMVISYLQLLKRRSIDKFDKEQLDYLNFAEEGAQRMNMLMQNLLEYSRLASQEINVKEVDLNVVMSDVLLKLSTLITRTQAIIEVTKLPTIFCHESHITQVFQNLITNGIKFQDEKIPEITITYQEETLRYVFAVKDNGIGIEEGFIDQIFQVFKRLNSRQKYQGSGVGLSICKRIVTTHLGEIWLDSSPNKGTTVFFSISKNLN